MLGQGCKGQHGYKASLAPWCGLIQPRCIAERQGLLARSVQTCVHCHTTRADSEAGTLVVGDGAKHGMAEQGRAEQGRAGKGGAYCCLRRVRLWWVMVWLALRRCRSWARRLFSPATSTSSVCHPTQRRCSCRPSSPLPWISLVRLFTTASRGPGKDIRCVCYCQQIWG